MCCHDAIIAGFGGQGILLAGKLLVWAGMLDDRHVTWFPSYGGEMRGGTANCTVIVSDEDIGSPIVDRPEALLAFNQASVDRFARRVAKGGFIIVNSSLATRDVEVPGVRLIRVAANEVAERLGDIKAANMVMLGAYLKASGSLGLDKVISALESVIPAKYKDALPVNIAALRDGYALV
ncbi:MAG: 2-oxoacid:acceptor oxidoreductase family protein [Nitrospirae bacterium]|nr:2-oxoacid:acceptor oxidoreductase family protein [Nitrospirota bacterium]MBI5694819.1 2-oxoacid:acceptor oxidoreductase family protein [Nitrospirota bacterium]